MFKGGLGSPGRMGGVCNCPGCQQIRANKLEIVEIENKLQSQISVIKESVQQSILRLQKECDETIQRLQKDAEEKIEQIKNKKEINT